MSNIKKTLTKVLDGRFDKSISFNQLRLLLKRLGFKEKIKSSHHIFVRDDVIEILNIQPKGKHAKPYQVKQVREVILKYKLHSEFNYE